MDYWIDGVLDRWDFEISKYPCHSINPTIHLSITPMIQIFSKKFYGWSIEGHVHVRRHP